MNNSDLAAPANVVKSNAECEDTEDFNFRWDWCNQNINSNEIKRICYGTVYYQDMIFSSIKLEMALSKQCLFSSGNSQDISVAGCNRTIRREYSSIYKAEPKSLVDECYDNSQLVISLEKQMGSDKDFKAIKP